MLFLNFIFQCFCLFLEKFIFVYFTNLPNILIISSGFCPAWIPWCFLNVQVNNFQQAWEAPQTVYLQVLFLCRLPTGTPILCVLTYMLVPTGLCSDFSLVHPFSLPTASFQMTLLHICLFFLWSSQISYWAPLVKFSFQSCFSTPHFLFG